MKARASVPLIDLGAVLLVDVSANGWRNAEAGTPLKKAQGVRFTCPKCGAHQVVCLFKNRGVPPNLRPGPGRWHPEGTGVADLHFAGPGAISVSLTSGCRWHGFIQYGAAVTIS